VDGVNLFMFVHNNPILFLDPDGRNTAFERYLERQFATRKGAEEVLRMNRWIGDAAQRVITPRVVGAVQIVGGAAEMAVGVAGVVAPEPLTSAGGALLYVHGADTFSTGLETWRTEEVQDTRTQQFAESVALDVGASPEWARGVGIGFDIAVGAGASLVTSSARVGVQEGAEIGLRELSEAAAREGGEGTSVVVLREGASASLERGNAMFSLDDLRGVEPAPPELLEAVQRKGRTVVIAQPGSDEMRFLDYFRAEASVGGETMEHILLRPNPSRAAVLEEFLHGTQFRAGMITDDLSRQAAEVQVKDFMVRHQRLLGLSDEDADILRVLQQREQEVLNQMSGR
jgi:hypothetical protein